MYTEKALKSATRIIQQIARAHQSSEEQVRSDITEAINAGRSNPDPAIQARWRTFCFSGQTPTVEEFILWAGSMGMHMIG